MNKSEEMITVKKATLWKAAFFVAVVIILYLLFAGSGTSGTVVAGDTAPSQNDGVVANAGTKAVDLGDGDHVLGDPNAPISVVEFSDFECPFCSRAFYGAVAELKASDAFKNGQINFVYKQFPLTSIHRYAQKSAEASECAADQGAFWEYHDMLFENQNALDTDSLKAYAQNLGLDVDVFASCLDSGEKAEKVSDDTDAAAASGGRGTPFFVIQNKDNGEVSSVSGAVPFSEIQKAITAVA